MDYCVTNTCDNGWKSLAVACLCQKGNFEQRHLEIADTKLPEEVKRCCPDVLMATQCHRENNDAVLLCDENRWKENGSRNCAEMNATTPGLTKFALECRHGGANKETTHFDSHDHFFINQEKG